MVRTTAVLISAHLISDFLLQPDEMVRLKKKKIFLILHAAIHALVTYIFLQNWTCWLVPVIVFVVHLVIDAVKKNVMILIGLLLSIRSFMSEAYSCLPG